MVWVTIGHTKHGSANLAGVRGIFLSNRGSLLDTNIISQDILFYFTHNPSVSRVNCTSGFQFDFLLLILCNANTF